jgi:hypothetical protein
MRTATAAPVAPQYNSNLQLSPIKPPIEPAVVAPQKPDPAILAKADYDSMIKQVGSMDKNDIAGRIVAIDTFLKEHGESTLAPSARTLREGIAATAQFDNSHAQVNDLPDQPIQDPSNRQQEPPPVPSTEQTAEAGKVYTEFQKEFLASLRKHDRRLAGAQLDQARKNPVLNSLQSELAQDGKALEWAEANDAMLAKGLERLRDLDDFELQTTRQKLHVGKHAPYKLMEIKDGVLQVGTQEVSMPVSISDLSPQTYDRIVLMALGNDAAGVLQRAFMETLALSGAESVKTAKSVQADLAKARSLGVTEADVKYVSSILDATVKSSREAYAAETLARFEKSMQAKDWSEAEKYGRQLLAELSDTVEVQKKADLKDLVEGAARKSGPLREYTITLQQGQPVLQGRLDKYAGTSASDIYPNHAPEGAIQVAQVGETGWCMLIQFIMFTHDGGFLPDNTEILQANLVIYKLSAYPCNIELHNILKVWNANEVSWMLAAKGNPWTSPGGDFDSKVAARSYSDEKIGWCDFDVTESLRAAKKDNRNFGWQLKVNELTNILKFATGTNEDISRRPKLILKVRCSRLSGDKP